MELMTSLSTSSEAFDISVTNGYPNYNINFSNQALLLAVSLGASSVPVSVSPFTFLYQKLLYHVLTS